MTASRRWDELQNRWAAGEMLTPDEERERLEHAVADPLARRELEIFADLRGSVAGPHETPGDLVEGVLDSYHGRPRLRVIAPDAPAALPRKPSRDRRRGARIAGAALAAAALAAGAFVYVRGSSVPDVGAPRPLLVAAPARAELVLASGEVEIGGQAASVGGAPLAQGVRVKTGEGRACITIEPRIDVCLAGHTAALVESLDGAKVRVRVETGTVLAALGRREPDHTFSLVADDMSATARGTVFAVQRSADADDVEVIVVEGSVDVAQGSVLRETVAPHSRLRLKKQPFSIERSAIGRGDEARLWTLGAERELWANPHVGILQVRGREPGLEIEIDQEGPLTLPVWAFVPAGKRRITTRAGAGPEVVSFVDVVAGETQQIVLPEVAPREPSAEPPSAASPASLLGAARRELGAGNAEGALAVYRRLRATFPKSPEAQTVLVTMGKLELDRKQAARALSHFDAYLASGGGALHQEALAGKINALRALGRGAEEKQAILRYLERHPGGFEAPAFRKRLQSASQ